MLKSLAPYVIWANLVFTLYAVLNSNNVQDSTMLPSGERNEVRLLKIIMGPP